MNASIACWILSLWPSVQSEAFAAFQEQPPKEKEIPSVKKAGQAPPPPFGTSMSFYPIPAISTSKNEGTTYGLLGAFLFPNEEGDVTQLFSLDLAYRSIVGANGFVDYRNYLDRDTLLKAYLYEAARVENEHLVSYENRTFLEDYALRLEFQEARVSTDRFFGIGRRTKSSDESAFTSNSYQVLGAVGAYLTNTFRIEATGGLRRFRVGLSLVKDVLQTLAAFPDQPGIRGGWVMAEGGRIVYDTRDSVNTPTRGEFVSLSVETAHYFSEGAGRPFQTVGFEVEKLWPYGNDAQFVLVAHFKAQYSGGEVPFWELPTLGGPTTLRSFGGNRFTNNTVLVANLEGRLRIVSLEIEGVTGEAQIAPFLDLGETYDVPGHLFRSNFREGFHYSYGAGLRGVVRPYIVGRMDVAFGSEGLAISVGLDYPF
jgi:outer membrane protein assembly factor BamA